MSNLATIHFDEEGVGCLADTLNGLCGRTFDLKTKKENKTVILLSCDSRGTALLVDFDGKTGEAKEKAKPFTVNLYSEGVSLTYC